MHFQNYESFKVELDKELMQEAAGFVRIGYLLRVAQDTNILSESEYDNVNDFAKAEYGLDKSQVSRFMAINERFSEGGYSDRLETQYQNFGVAKLSIMLQLPDVVNDQLTPDMTKSEINAIKDEVKEEEKISDLEVMMEDKSEDSLLKQIINNILKEHPEIYKLVWEENKKAQEFNIRPDSSDYAEDILAASGEALYTTRVSGVGKMMLSIKSDAKILVITNIRTGEIEEPTWEELGKCLRFSCFMDSYEKEYETRFEAPYPKEDEKKPEKPTGKVMTTPKKEKKAESSPKKKENRINTECDTDSYPKTAAGSENEKIAPVQQAENRINTECEGQSENAENTSKNDSQNEALEEKNEVESEKEVKNADVQEPENRINTEYDTDSTEKMAAGSENQEIAPVQQSENRINTECERQFEDYKLKSLKNALNLELKEALAFIEKGNLKVVEQNIIRALKIVQECMAREEELDDEE